MTQPADLVATLATVVGSDVTTGCVVAAPTGLAPYPTETTTGSPPSSNPTLLPHLRPEDRRAHQAVTTSASCTLHVNQPHAHP